MTKFNYIPYLDKRTNKPCMLEDNPHELTKTFKYEDGSEKIVSIATFKRWYKKVEDEPFVFVGTNKSEVSVEVPVDFTKEPTDPANLSAIDTAVKELTEKLKEEKEKNAEGKDTGSKEKEKKTPTKKTAGKRSSKKDASKVVVDNSESNISAIFGIVEEVGGEVGIPSDPNMRFRPLRYNGRQFCKFMWSKNGIRLYFRNEETPNIYKDCEIVNYSMKYLCIFNLVDDTNRGIIKALFESAIEHEKQPRTKNRKK